MLDTVFINIIISENSVFVSGINKAHTACFIGSINVFGRFQKNNQICFDLKFLCEHFIVRCLSM